MPWILWSFGVGFQCELLSHLCGLCRNGTSVEDKMKQPGRTTSTSTSLCSKHVAKTHENNMFYQTIGWFFFKKGIQKWWKKNRIIILLLWCFYLVPVTHVLKTHQLVRFRNLKFLLARATIPSSTGFTPNICSSIIAWLRAADPSPVAPRCGGDLWAGTNMWTLK